MRISDWSSDVCSSDLRRHRPEADQRDQRPLCRARDGGYPQREEQEGERIEQIEKEQQQAALPGLGIVAGQAEGQNADADQDGRQRDRKSTRLTPVTNAHLVCRLLLEKKKNNKAKTDKPNQTTR